MAYNQTTWHSVYCAYYPTIVADVDVAAASINGLMANAEIHVFGAGNLSVRLTNGDDVIIESVPAGHVLPLSVQRINLTGTTATKILVLY